MQKITTRTTNIVLKFIHDSIISKTINNQDISPRPPLPYSLSFTSLKFDSVRLLTTWILYYTDSFLSMLGIDIYYCRASKSLSRLTSHSSSVHSLYCCLGPRPIQLDFFKSYVSLFIFKDRFINATTVMRGGAPEAVCWRQKHTESESN